MTAGRLSSCVPNSSDQEEKQRKEMCFRLSTDLQELIEQSMT